MTATRIVLQTAFVLLALAGAGYYTWKHWRDMVLVWQLCRPSVLVAAGAVTLLGYILRGAMWSPLLRGVTGITVSPSAAFRISSISWMGRYIPGKLWAVAGKAYLSADSPEQVVSTALAAAIDTVWLLVSGLFLALICILAGLGRNGALREYSVVVAIALPLGVIACHPRVYYPVANNVLRLLGKPVLPRRPSFALMATLLVTNMAAFLLWSLGIMLLLAPYMTFSFSGFCNVSLIFALAWVSGFLVLIAPAGIGVRDTILAVGLKGILGLDAGAVLLGVLGSRALTTASEFLCFLVALKVRDHRLVGDICKVDPNRAVLEEIKAPEQEGEG